MVAEYKASVKELFCTHVYNSLFLGRTGASFPNAQGRTRLDYQPLGGAYRAESIAVISRVTFWICARAVVIVLGIVLFWFGVVRGQLP